MSDMDRSSFIGEYGPADWLRLKQEILDVPAFEREAILDLIEKRKDIETILDCGAGEGNLAQRLHSLADAKITCGVDLFRTYLETAKERQESAKIYYQEASFYQLPFNDAVFDLVAIQSTFDIMNGDRLMGEMLRVLKEGGWLYISMAYDSSYPFSPVYDEDLEHKIRTNFDVYAIQHEVSEGIRGGDARTGRKLWHYAYKYGLTTIRYTSSDWILYPKPKYTAEEKAVLHLLLQFYYQPTLDPDNSKPSEHRVDPKRLNEWYQTRQRQIENSELTLNIHQNSLLAEKPRGWSASASIKSKIDLAPGNRKKSTSPDNESASGQKQLDSKSN